MSLSLRLHMGTGRYQSIIKHLWRRSFFFDDHDPASEVHISLESLVDLIFGLSDIMR